MYLGLGLCRQNFIYSLLLMSSIDSRIIPGRIHKTVHHIIIGTLEAQEVIGATLIVTSVGGNLVRETCAHLVDVGLCLIAGGVAAIHSTFGLIDLLFGRWEIELGSKQGFLSLLIGASHLTSG